MEAEQPLDGALDPRDERKFKKLSKYFRLLGQHVCLNVFVQI